MFKNSPVLNKSNSGEKNENIKVFSKISKHAKSYVLIQHNEFSPFPSQIWTLFGLQTCLISFPPQERIKKINSRASLAYISLSFGYTFPPGSMECPRRDFQGKG